MFSFLKKLGQFLANAVPVLLGIGPILRPFLGSSSVGQLAYTGFNDLTLIAQRVLEVEAALQGSGRGAEKLAAAIPLVKGIVQTSELVAGKKVANDALFSKGVEEVTQGVVDILNSIHPDEAKRV